MAVDDGGNVFAAAGMQLFASRDDGSSWELIEDGLPPIKAMIA